MVPVAQEAVRQDLQAMFRGAIRAGLELFLERSWRRLSRLSNPRTSRRQTSWRSLVDVMIRTPLTVSG